MIIVTYGDVPPDKNAPPKKPGGGGGKPPGGGKKPPKKCSPCQKLQNKMCVTDPAKKDDPECKNAGSGGQAYQNWMESIFWAEIFGFIFCLIM